MLTRNLSKQRTQLELENQLKVQNCHVVALYLAKVGNFELKTKFVWPQQRKSYAETLSKRPKHVILYIFLLGERIGPVRKAVVQRFFWKSVETFDYCREVNLSTF